MTLFFRSSPSSSYFSSRQQLHITYKVFFFLKKKKTHLNSSNFKNNKKEWPWYHAVLLGFSWPDSLCRCITAGICSWYLWFVNFLVILAQPDQVLLSLLLIQFHFHSYCSWRPQKDQLFLPFDPDSGGPPSFFGSGNHFYHTFSSLNMSHRGAFGNFKVPSRIWEH